MHKKIESRMAPAAIGPYSQAIQAGDLVFCSGQIPLQPQSGEIVSGGIVAQTEQVMKNLQQVLLAAGTNFDTIVRTTIYLVDLGDFAVVNEIYGKHFTGVAPARVTVQVAALPKGALIEIDAIAYLGR